MHSIKRVLVTGGAGYIGSHTCKQLVREGIEPIVFDNLSNGYQHNVKWGPLVCGDLRNSDDIVAVLTKHNPDAIIHFAALAYVGDSVKNPESYYKNNVIGSMNLLSAMRQLGLTKLVFSSTCSTYGIPKTIPIAEECLQSPINPYGASKQMVERIIYDYSLSYGMNYAILRYFNACGADPDGELAEEHNPETHLIPRCLQAAAGLIEAVDIFGHNYPTPDGTCVRDYIHVSDLAEAHVKSLKKIHENAQALTLNLGTGSGHSVREIIEGIQSIVGRDVPFRVRPRRSGDPAILIADASKARQVINFTPRHSDLRTIIRTAWQRYSE